MSLKRAASAPPSERGVRPPPIELRGMSKAFGAVAALHDVSLTGHAGSVHAITGENGAGKSTLMKLLAGRAPARRRRAVHRRQAAPPAQPGSGAPRRHLHGVPGTDGAAEPERRREPAARPRAHALRLAQPQRHAGRSARGAGANRHRAGSAARLRLVEHRRAAAGGDRQGRVHRRLGVHLRRADRAAEPRRGRQARSLDRRVEGAGQAGLLHQPSARRDLPPVRHGDGAEGWPMGGDRADQCIDPRFADHADGRSPLAGTVSATRQRRARCGRAGRAQPDAAGRRRDGTAATAPRRDRRPGRAGRPGPARDRARVGRCDSAPRKARSFAALAVATPRASTRATESCRSCARVSG